MDRLTARLSSRYLSYGLPFLYLLTSIAFYLHTYDSAQVKITLVQTLGTVLMGMWYVKLLSEGDIPFKRYLPVVLPLIASLIIGAAGYLHAPYAETGLDETLRRVFYVHFALIAITEINTMQRLKRLITFLLVATAISVIYGVMEMLDRRFWPASQFSSGIDPFIWRQAFAARIFSTFGNPNFFGNFLVIVTPITLALLLKRNRERPLSVFLFAIVSIAVSAMIWQVEPLARLARMPSYENFFFFLLLGGFTFVAALQFSFLGILFFLITVCNIMTLSKGAWVGYAASVISFLMLVLFYFSQFQSEKLKRTLKMGALATLLTCTVGVGVVSMQRVDSIRFRICTWVSTWEMGYARPFFGNGIGSFRPMYPAYRRPQIFHIEGKHNTETDHAENEYFEVFSDEGLIGLGVFLWIIVTFTLLGLRALRRFTEGLSIRDPVSGKRKYSDDPRAYYMLGIVAAFWGMLIHNLMDVSLRFVSSGIFLWLLVGLIGAMAIHDPLREKDVEDDANGPAPTVSPILATATHLLRVVALAVLGYVLVYVLRKFADAQGPLPNGFGEQLLWLISWMSFAGTVGASCWMLVRISLSMRLPQGFLVLIAMSYPLYTFWGYFMADVHHNRGIFFSKQQKWNEALANYNETVRLNPTYIMAYYFMGNVYTDRWGPGDFERAMKEYGRAWAIAPNYVQSHHQAGLVYLKKGADDKNAADRLRDSGQLAAAAQGYAAVENDWKQALFYFQKYHDIDPVFEPNYLRKAWVKIQLAELAGSRGDRAQAERYMDEAEAAYKESVGAWVCGSPQNDVMGERWDRTHRHWNSEVFENLANARFMRGRFKEAVKSFRMAVWVDPTNVRALKNLALTYGRIGDAPNYRKTWLEIRRQSPTDPEVQKMFSQRPPGA